MNCSELIGLVALVVQSPIDPCPEDWAKSVCPIAARGHPDVTGGEDAEVPMSRVVKTGGHGQDELVQFHGGGAPHGDGFLSHAGEPLADAALAQQAEHLLFNQPGEQQPVEEFDLPVRGDAAVFDAQFGDVGVDMLKSRPRPPPSGPMQAYFAAGNEQP